MDFQSTGLTRNGFRSIQKRSTYTNFTSGPTSHLRFTQSNIGFTKYVGVSRMEYLILSDNIIVLLWHHNLTGKQSNLADRMQ